MGGDIITTLDCESETTSIVTNSIIAKLVKFVSASNL